MDRMHALFFLLAPAVAADWPTARGPDAGTQFGAGTGGVTGEDGGWPVFAWTAPYGSASTTTGYAAVLDADADGTPEVIGLSRSRVWLWAADGTVLGVTDPIATPYVHGLYDLDGDGATDDLVVVGAGVGGGVFVFDAGTLALQWRNDDPGNNGGGSLAETVVSDTDGDGIPELLWTTSFVGYPEYRLLSFASGFAAPTEVVLTLPDGFTGTLPAVAGRYNGAPGGFLVEQSTSAAWFEVADRLDSGVTCSPDLTRCMRVNATFTNIHTSSTSGDRHSVDADGDGVDEYFAASANDLRAVDLILLDPQDGGLRWAWRYGNGGGVPLYVFAYAPAGQGFAASDGRTVLVASVEGDGTDETDIDGLPADDCLDAPDTTGTIVFDGATGVPLASLADTHARATMDGDRDGLPEIVLTDPDAAERIAGYEVVCDGTDGGCGSGCALVEAWSVEGALPLVRPQQLPDTSSRAVGDSVPALVDLDGDAVPEVLAVDGTDLVAWRIGADGVATDIGRYATGDCNTLGGWIGSGADTWLLLEGSACYAVLDANLAEIARFDVSVTQGAALALAGTVDGGPLLTIGTRVYTDPANAEAMATPDASIAEIPFRFADLDADGADELLAYTVSGSVWRVVLYGWESGAWTERWRVDPSAFGLEGFTLPSSYLSYQHAIGDFDGDGDDDVAFLAIDAERGATSFPGRARLLFVDGGSGAVIGEQVAPEEGLSVGFGSPMIARDLSGADGIDEVMFVGATSVSVYGPTDGYVYGFSTETTSESMVGDFDGDGAEELVLGAGFTGTDLYRVQMLELDGTPVWEAIPGSSSGSLLVHAAADIDEDGVLDVVVGGGYGELYVYSGPNGALLDGYPLHLQDGEALPAPDTHMRRILAITLADIDGDGHVEGLVAHDDGVVYAVDLAPAEGDPAVRWSVWMASPVTYVRTMDADSDGQLEALVLAYDGTARLIDGGDVNVVIEAPIADACDDGDVLEVSGTATGVDTVEVDLQGVNVATATVSDGRWSAYVPWPGEGLFRVEAWGVLDGVRVAGDTLSVTHFDDADGDGVSECDDDCDDSDADRFPGNPERCDGLDQDCAGTEADEADDDGDGYLACEPCDGGACSSYLRGGGGCACDATQSPTAALAGVAAAALIAAMRRSRRRAA